jgi:HrpA-like RNA helicase
MLPLGVRYGKMLLVSAHANVLDYGIILVSILSEASPFRKAHIEKSDNGDSDTDDNSDEDSLAGLDDIDRNNAIKQDRKKEKDLRKMRWQHDGGDALAGMLAVGAYSYAGRGAGGKTEKMASKKFCEENGLEPVIMERVQKMRTHLAHLSKQRLHKAGGVAASTGKFLSNMPPPNKLQERILMQVCFCLRSFEVYLTGH